MREADDGEVLRPQSQRAAEMQPEPMREVVGDGDLAGLRGRAAVCDSQQSARHRLAKVKAGDLDAGDQPTVAAGRGARVDAGDDPAACRQGGAHPLHRLVVTRRSGGREVSVDAAVGATGWQQLRH